MNLKSGYPFSLVRNGIPFDYPKLQKNTHCEIVIMGAGISGALLAYEFTRRGMECMLVDARSVGLVSTCASTSLIQYEIDQPMHVLADKLGEDRAVRAYRCCEEVVDEIAQIAREVGYDGVREKTSLQIAAKRRHRDDLKKEYAMRRRHGFAVDYLEEAELETLYGFHAAAALLTERAADMDCYILTHCLLQFLLKKGVQVFDRTEVVERKTKGGEIHLSTSRGDQIRCRHLVYANGYEAAQWLPSRFVQLRSTYVTITEHMEEHFPFWKDDTLVWTTGNPYLYARSTPDYRLMVGGGDENFIDPRKRDRLVPKKTGQLLRDFHKIHPALHLEPEFSWTGVFGTTPDGLPYIGHYKAKDPGIFALGYGGNGITFGQVAAHLVADMIQGRANPGHALFSFER